MPDVTTLLPPNATSQESALEQATARIGEIPPSVRDMWNPDTCPGALLPWLAWGFGADQWDSTWSDDQKRQAIKKAIFVKRHKGTIGSVTQAIAALGHSITIQEWFSKLPIGAPYTFDILVDSSQIGVDEATLTKVLSLVDTYKNLRSHLVAVKPSITTRGGPTFAGACLIGNEITVAFSQNLKYSDGYPADDLELDAEVNGEANTIAAIDALDVFVNTTMPTANYW